MWLRMALCVRFYHWQSDGLRGWLAPIIISAAFLFMLWIRRDHCEGDARWMADTHAFLSELFEDGNVSLERPYIENIPTFTLNIPNIIHFIHFSHTSVNLSCISYLSMLSAHKNQMPDAIYLHCDNCPLGYWWDSLQKQVNITVTQMQSPHSVFGHNLTLEQHKVDVAKLQILLKYGGIYMENDVLLIKPISIMGNYKVILGEVRKRLDMSIIVAEKNAEFIRYWYDSYRTNYKGALAEYNSVAIPFKLRKRNPKLVHSELFTWNQHPDKIHRNIWHKMQDWSDIQAIHLGVRGSNKDLTLEQILQRKTTVGAVARYIHAHNIDT